MEFKNPLLVVKNIEKSKRFYKDVLGLEVLLDFGANVTLTGGVALQSEETWQEFIKNRYIIMVMIQNCILKKNILMILLKN